MDLPEGTAQERYTLLLGSRSHVVSGSAAAVLIEALAHDQPTATIGIELNGESSGEWEVTVNVRQVVALIKHPTLVTAEPGFGEAQRRLHLVSTET